VTQEWHCKASRRFNEAKRRFKEAKRRCKEAKRRFKEAKRRFKEAKRRCIWDGPEHDGKLLPVLDAQVDELLRQRAYSGKLAERLVSEQRLPEPCDLNQWPTWQ